jgi:two-component system phosphate regulon response regulator PhoB
MEGMTIDGAQATQEQSGSVAQDRLGFADTAELHRILIVDRDSKTTEPLHLKLAQAGFSVTTLNSGEDAATEIDRSHPHLVVLDWDLPGFITMDLLRHVRRATGSRTPRLMALSNFSAEQQVVNGLELGLDDYVVKPFSVREVVARVRAVLRSFTTAKDDSDYLEFHRLRMDVSEGRVTVLDRTVSLRSMEFRLLEFMMRHAERAFQREHLLQRVWGHDCRAEVRAVDVTIQRIRHALAPHGCEGYVQTIRGVGYRMSATNDSR